jgi:hypothetical protein
VRRPILWGQVAIIVIVHFGRDIVCAGKVVLTEQAVGGVIAIKDALSLGV